SVVGLSSRMRSTGSIFGSCTARCFGTMAASLVAFAARDARADRSTLAPEAGYNYGEVETGRSAALGGASRALGKRVRGLHSNPANIALTRVYHLHAFALVGPEARRQMYGASAADSVTNKLAGAIGGNYGVLDPDGINRKWTDFRLALAVPLSDRFFVGV